jgi:hypothetical protein
VAGLHQRQHADEGIIIEGDRITERVVESAEGERFSVKLERCTDPNQVRYQDPLTGVDVVLSAKHARRWKVDLNWLREEIITALGSSLQGLRGRHLDKEPVFLDEVDIDGHGIALYFAARMSNDRQYAKVDAALRLRPRAAPGIVLTTASVPFSFAGTNVIIAIEDVLVSGQSAAVIDDARLKVAYRHGQLAAMGGASVSIKVSADGYSAVLCIPGKAPWRVTSKNKPQGRRVAAAGRCLRRRNAARKYEEIVGRHQLRFARELVPEGLAVAKLHGEGCRSPSLAAESADTRPTGG